jgi:hypothetical protein
MTNTRKVLNGCGKRGKKKANEPKEDEGIGQNKLGRMGMMDGSWTTTGHRGKTDNRFSIGCLLGGPGC